jgi:peptide/nickel transport system substrate-binding protein
MNCNPTNPGDGVSRRSVLAAGAAGLALPTSGCVDRVESVVDQDVTDRLALSITTVPADDDREVVQIARHLESTLEAVGADVTIDMRSTEEFLESVLIDHEFDLYVGRHPGGFDPDFLYGALHSAYADEAGWQNPFGFGDTELDGLLEFQRRTEDDAEREDAIGDLLEKIAVEKPFDPICFPEEHRVVRTDFDGWDGGDLATRHGYLGLDPDGDRLRVLVTDSRPSRNLNPLAATFRDRGTIVDLLYDSLATEHDGELVPWLATDWSIDDGTIDVTLREECPFHDAEDAEENDVDENDEEDRYVTAEDVAFTYEFLQDTSLEWGDWFDSSPAPRYRSRTSMIDGIEVEALDPSTIRIDVAAGTAAVAERVLTVPILPKHRWEAQVESRAERDDEFATPQGAWSLVTMGNIPPVGSGPFRYADHSERESLTLERYDDHFTQRDDVDLPAVEVEELRFGIDPGSASSVERVANDGADLTMSMLDSHVLDDVSERDDVEQIESERDQLFYHVGFNTRVEPFDDAEVRRVVSRLIDKAWLADGEVFNGYATPVATPLSDEWVPDDLAWNGEDPVTPFFGADNDLDVDAARAAFEEAGFEYDDQGRLLP